MGHQYRWSNYTHVCNCNWGKSYKAEEIYGRVRRELSRFRDVREGFCKSVTKEVTSKERGEGKVYQWGKQHRRPCDREGA